ncbi:ShlB/FhaC/HecB family hemolysin secretion/activation protein [Pseudomonas sp. CFBP 8770]|uniref:ShlB/FhaC/HecB family hemolysin secretion/activation protein n=1 Tax=unclassified Pseudomonas TaxID=196821 RepID=UPI00177ACEE1|nr:MULTISPECIES: ShlB/FhaC/HecB family hemolysin secretion/activation protein [unclassified Pseudomonas]MBD8473689.1 ShlB/FhaC/HecB family hemolysin secretion/activation protein [Pseudomonas sp. CFBP 8773]MBD8646817.1 ShlB/FhaC/HecB family hemolysin secretion/activation protein [Pseudomonas sp. CFBP 8770]
MWVIAARYITWYFVACIFCVTQAFAAATTPGEQDFIRDRQDRLLQEQRQRLEELKNLPGEQLSAAAPPTVEDVRCFTIQRIDIQGADALAPAQMAELVQPYLGQCLGVAQLNELLGGVTDRYLQLGLVTSRAYLPQQDLSTGILTLQVVEGRLEGIRPADDSGLSPREVNMAFPGQVGELLNLREVEQLVDQLNRLPSNHAQIELAPGEVLGGSNVLVRNTTQKPWRASLSRNNDGQRSTGQQQWSAGLDWDSPLGLADQLVLRGSHDAVSDHHRGSKSTTVYYSVPWGWWNLNYSYSQSEYGSQAYGNGFAFKQNGDSQNHQFRAERVIHRDAVSKTSVNGGLAYLRSNNYLSGNRLEVSSNRISEAQFGLNHGRRIGNAFVNLDLGMQQGIGAFDAQSRKIEQHSDPNDRYRKYTATLSYLQGFNLWGETLSFTSLANGQRSEDVLFSPQRMSLSGQSSMRGIKDQNLSGDSGGYWRNDLRWTRPVSLAWLRPALDEYGIGLGYDQGVIRSDRHNDDQHGRVSSNSVELFARGQHFATSVTFAHSLERPDALSDRETPIYFRLDLFL